MEAGEGEEGRDCLLETQEESPSASAGEPSSPPANFSSSSAPLLPLGLTKVRPLSPRAWSPEDQPQARAPRPASRRGIVRPGCCPPATWRPTQPPSAFKLCWGLWSGSRKPPAALSWQFQELEGSKGGAKQEEDRERAASLSSLATESVQHLLSKRQAGR